MSRIGKLPIKIPTGVKVLVNGATVSIEGPLGKNEKTFDDSVLIKVENGEVCIYPTDASSDHSLIMHGTVRSIVASMVAGVVSGYKKNLEINGVGFKATMKGKVIDLDLGFSHDILHEIPARVKIDIDQTGTKLSVSGVDKQLVGQVAADIKSYYPIEPYKGKGVRIIGEFVRRKEGKKTA
ncbi:MAG: 50S ribosomal protein L6 [Puniceicoccales bacterium]|jgi:large subunit ribosomal protein L6|nr:50S ribosomal protein L6 [Puniceicoccales bacterium]